MTAPSPAVIRLPRNKFLGPIVDALPGYREALEGAQSADEFLQNMPAVPKVPAELAAGPVSAEWHTAEDERDAAIATHEKHRQRTLNRKNAAIGQTNSVLRGNVDLILRQLHLNLQELLAKAALDAQALIAAGVETASHAIQSDHVAEWQRLHQDICPDYELLRDCQDAVHMHVAPARYWRSARPAVDGEDCASLLHIKNLPALWPDWRQRGRTSARINVDGSTTRPEPWPKPSGPEFLLWAFTSHAELWIPTTREFDAEFGPAKDQPAVPDDAQLAARRAEFDALDQLLIGPHQANVQRQRQAAHH
jgi:hypothetical protein